MSATPKRPPFKQNSSTGDGTTGSSVPLESRWVPPRAWERGIDEGLGSGPPLCRYRLDTLESRQSAGTF